MSRIAALVPFAAALLLAGPAGAQDLTEPGVRSQGVVQTPIEEPARPLAGPGADASRVRKMPHLGLNLGQCRSSAEIRKVYPTSTQPRCTARPPRSWSGIARLS
ncbi:MAG: hypothetical protein U5L06_09425 [Rhodovibrio sp.]|nr:hypothetical protein [Rhodovibrio sp.]